MAGNHRAEISCLGTSHIRRKNSCKGSMNINTTVTIIIMRVRVIFKSGKDIYLVSIFVTVVQYISTLRLQNNLYFFPWEITQTAIMRFSKLNR